MFRQGLSLRSLCSIGKPHPKVQFSPREDSQLLTLVMRYGDKNWEFIAKMMKNRNARQCKERYTKYLSPDINRNPWTPEEDELLKEKLSQFGPKWVKISKFFDRRTDAALKNRWCILKKSLLISNDSTSSESEKEVPKPIEKDEKNDVLPSIESWFTDFENLDIPIDMLEQV